MCVFFVTAARADNYGLDKTVEQTGGLLPKNIAGKSSPAEVVGTIVSVALSFIGIVFFLLVLYAGFTWMTAMGNSEKVTNAKEMLEAAAIGLLLVLASYAIARFVFTNLGGGAGSSSTSQSQNGSPSGSSASCQSALDCNPAQHEICDGGVCKATGCCNLVGVKQCFDDQTASQCQIKETNSGNPTRFEPGTACSNPCAY